MLEMVHRLESFVHSGGDLPPVSLATFQTVAGFWRGDSSDAATLTKAKTRTWQDLRSREGDSHSITSQASVFDRALLCLLDPTGNEAEAEDYAEWFEQMLAML